MTLVKRNSSPTAFPKLFDDFFIRDFKNWERQNHSITNTTLPSVNIKESNDGFVVEMAVPGMRKDDFQIELNNEKLTISSQKATEKELKEGEHFTRQEYSYQSFQRSFQLPKSVVDDSKIQAKYENGLLHILIPKKEEAKVLPPRQIAIQ